MRDTTTHLAPAPKPSLSLTFGGVTESIPFDQLDRVLANKLRMTGHADCSMTMEPDLLILLADVLSAQRAGIEGVAAGAALVTETLTKSTRIIQLSSPTAWLRETLVFAAFWLGIEAFLPADMARSGGLIALGALITSIALRLRQRSRV